MTSSKKETLSFNFAPGMTIAVMIALTILIVLGTWQLQRHSWKLDLIAAVEARATAEPVALSNALNRLKQGADIRYYAVKVTGQFDHAQEAHVFGTLGPTPGYYIFTPFISDDPQYSKPIYINRGFVPENKKNIASRQEGQVQGSIMVSGLFRYAEQRSGIAKYFTPIDQPQDNIWYTRDPIKFSKHRNDTQKSVYNWYIDSAGTEHNADYPRGNTTRIEFNNRHLEYALTWYGLTLTLIGVWLAYPRYKPK